MPIKQTKYKFSAGELDPQLYGRTDLANYDSACAEMTNVDLLIQGGFKKSDGLKFISKLAPITQRETSLSIDNPNGGNAANINDNDDATFYTTTTQLQSSTEYVVVKYELLGNADTRFIDLRNCRLTVSGSSSQFRIQGSYDDVLWTDIESNITLSTTAITRRYAVNIDYNYIRFVKIGADNLGTNVVTLSEFNINSYVSENTASKLIPFVFNVDQYYLLSFTRGNIAIFRNDVNVANIKEDLLTDNIVSKIKTTQSYDTMIIVQEDLTPLKLIRQGTDTDWNLSTISFNNIPRFDFDPIITTPAGTIHPNEVEGVTKMTASTGSPFSAASVGQYIQGGGGRARIIEYIDVKNVRVATEIPFYSTDPIATGKWEYLTGFEDVWSATRGYPATATFHKARLYFGGSKSRPQTIWGSKINLFFDFDLGSLYDDEGIDATLATDALNKIVNIKSTNGNLIVFTTNEEFLVKTGIDDNITPQNFNPVAVSRYGSENNFNISTLDNQNIYIQKGGKSIITYVYDSVNQVTGSSNLSLLSGHLFFNPKDFATRNATSTTESNLIMYINGNNNLILGTYLADQNVLGFSRRSTDGKFINIQSVENEVFAVVEREINGSNIRYIEKVQTDSNLDSHKTYNVSSPTNTFDGLSHLEGKEVYVIMDGRVLSPKTVTGGAVFTGNDYAQSICEIGLLYTPVVKTLPISTYNIPNLGTTIGKKKRIATATLRLYKTQRLTIQGYTVSFRNYEEENLQEETPYFTGDKKINGLLGWGIREQLEISQDYPLALNVSSITMDIAI